MVLIVISDFMQDEIYLNEEIKYYHGFDRILYYSTKGHVYSNEHLKLQNGVENGEQSIFYNNVFDRIYYLFKGIASKSGVEELIYILQNKNMSGFVIKSFSLFTAKGQLLFQHIRNDLKKRGIDRTEKIVFYSYRLGIGTYAAILLKKYFNNSKVISRAHGQDLFQFRNKYDYLPYRTFLLENLARLFCISENGKEYIVSKYPAIKYKVEVARLGTREPGRNKRLSNNTLVVVSCSRISRIKRIDLIAKALCRMNDIKIEWIHFGDGDEEYQREILNVLKGKPENLEVIFKGFVSNDKLRDIYKNMEATLFINLSESEGLPVSIMEAESVGMPIIATNVGGSCEAVVNGKNGFLLSDNPSLDEVENAIRHFILMNKSDYQKFCDYSYEIWKNKFDVDKNYKLFSDKIETVGLNFHA